MALEGYDVPLLSSCRSEVVFWICGYLNGEEQDLQMLWRNYQKHEGP
jgi:hypothetical protein